MAHTDITPNTTLKVLRNIPLENDYINTLYFAGRSSQTSYFQGKTKYTFSNLTYQRVSRGVIRVQRKIEDLYDCNYLMFQNASFEDKWFYAFITHIEYVNNITSDIYYEIDVMQTWLFEMTLTRCFVEREHSETDVIGENIVAEPVDTGELVFNYYEKLMPELDSYAIVLAISDTSIQTSGGIMNGVYSGAKLIAFPCTQTGATGINAYIDRFLQQPDAILGIYIVPYPALFTPPSNEGTWISQQDHSPRHILSRHQLSEHDTLDNYLPRNKKLYTYPFNFFHVDNANGRELNLRYEFFNDDNGYKNLYPQMVLSCNPNMPVTCVLRPRNYKGITQSNDGSGDTSSDQTCCAESIDLTSYPMCAWNVDSWNAWVAQNSVPESISILNKGAEMGASVANASIASQLLTSSKAVSAATKASVSGSMVGVGLALSAISMVSEIVNQRYTASIRADVCKGSLNNASINASDHKQNFFIGRMSVNRHMAAIIDDFFDKFGYATNRVKIPNIHSRPHWNYIKTIGSNVGGNIPAIDKKSIDAIFNNGITFWKDGSEVDNYTLDNSPT